MIDANRQLRSKSVGHTSWLRINILAYRLTIPKAIYEEYKL